MGFWAHRGSWLLWLVGVRSNQDLLWCVKIGVYMGFGIHRGSWLLWLVGVRCNQDLIWCVKVQVCMGFWVHRGSWLLWIVVFEMPRYRPRQHCCVCLPRLDLRKSVRKTIPGAWCVPSCVLYHTSIRYLSCSSGWPPRFYLVSFEMEIRTGTVTSAY